MLKRSLRWRALLGFLWTLVRTDFKVRYHGTIGGFLWALLKPLSMFAVLMVVFSFVFPDKPTYKLDLILGLFLWEFFAEGTKVGLLSLQAKSFLLTKSTFPRWIIVFASLANPGVTLLIFSVTMFISLWALGRPVTLLALGLFLGYLFQFALIVLGFSLFSSVLFLRYRDLNQVWDVVTHAGFFVAPIVFPMDVLPNHLRPLFYLWPPTLVIEFSRAALIVGDVPPLSGHLCLALVVAVSVIVGTAVFRRLAPRAAELL